MSYENEFAHQSADSWRFDEQIHHLKSQLQVGCAGPRSLLLLPKLLIFQLP